MQEISRAERAELHASVRRFLELNEPEGFGQTG